MSLTSLIRIWKNKGQIIEGITNNIFRREDVELVAHQRMHICETCPSEYYNNLDDKGCVMVGSQPCCDYRLGGCGCSLNLKTRSLSSSCPMGHWGAELTEQEEDALKEKLGINQ